MTSPLDSGFSNSDTLRSKIVLVIESCSLFFLFVFLAEHAQHITQFAKKKLVDEYSHIFNLHIRFGKSY